MITFADGASASATTSQSKDITSYFTGFSKECPKAMRTEGHSDPRAGTAAAKNTDIAQCAQSNQCIEPHSSGIHSPVLFEFQGEFENMEQFNGVFNPDTLQMVFEGYFLQGKKVKKSMTILKREPGMKVSHELIVQELVLFDEPPKYFMKPQLMNMR